MNNELVLFFFFWLYLVTKVNIVFSRLKHGPPRYIVGDALGDLERALALVGESR